LKLKRYVLIKSFSLFEIAAFTILIVILLIILFPGNYLNSFLKEPDTRNLNLQIKYLEYLIHKNPRFEYFKTLIYDYSISGKPLKALKLLSTLEKKYPNNVKGVNYLIFKYRILKNIYFSLKRNSIKEQIKENIKQTLQILLVKAGKSTDILKFIYSQSMEFNFINIAYNVANKLALLTKNPVWVKRAILLAVSVKSLSQRTLNTLLNLTNPKKLDVETLEIIVNYLFYVVKDYKNTYKILKAYLGKDNTLPQNIKNIYLYLLVYNDKIFEIQELIGNTFKKDNRKRLIKLAIQYAFAMKKLNLAKKLIDEYALAFPNDYAYITFVLKSSLATGDPFFARRIALKIMRVLNNE